MVKCGELDVPILFSETHYGQDLEKVKILCIKRPLTEASFEFHDEVFFATKWLYGEKQSMKMAMKEDENEYENEDDYKDGNTIGRGCENGRGGW